jgi:hypothetical protein
MSEKVGNTNLEKRKKSDVTASKFIDPMEQKSDKITSYLNEVRNGLFRNTSICF